VMPTTDGNNRTWKETRTEHPRAEKCVPPARRVELDLDTRASSEQERNRGRENRRRERRPGDLP